MTLTIPKALLLRPEASLRRVNACLVVLLIILGLIGETIWLNRTVVVVFFLLSVVV